MREIMARISVQTLTEKLAEQVHCRRQENTTDPVRMSLYLKTKAALWYWITILISLVTVIVFVTVPENAYPIVYVRYFLGLTFVLWLPGYRLTRALFPSIPSKKNLRIFGLTLRVALSIGLSLTLDILVGLVANYASLGINLTTIVFGLLFVNLALANVA